MDTSPVVPETRVGVAHFLILARIASRVVQLTRLWQAQVDYGGSRPASDQRVASGVLALLPHKIRVKAYPREIIATGGMDIDAVMIGGPDSTLTREVKQP